MAGRYRIGIDVGGTNTDAVILDERLDVVASVKRPTTARHRRRRGRGDRRGARGLRRRRRPDRATPCSAPTHCTNAIVERRGLGRVGILRLGAPATTAVPPLEGWPDDLACGDR